VGSPRLFVAVDVPDEVRAYLVDRLQSWQQQLPGWRWGDPVCWHLTLAFLGNVDDALRAELSGRLRRPADRYAPFEVGLGALGAFSRPAKATVLWIGVTTGREQLKRLAAPVSAAARRSGVDVDDKPYRPHLTLGRRRTPVDIRDQIALGGDLRMPTWKVTSYVLYQSHLGPHPRHEPIEHFDLAARR
jgi:RNA 2',3'-cyclic 3'-phosphodiesterase